MTWHSVNTSRMKKEKAFCRSACVNQNGLEWIHSHRGAFQNHNALSDMSNYTREIAIKECYLPSILQSHLIEVKRFAKEGKKNERNEVK